jgi:hypothetical protein
MRSLGLSAVTLRAYLETERAADTGEYHARVLEWIQRAGIASEFEPAEASLVAAPIGALTRKQATAAIWRSEGLGVLAWSLGQGAIPAHDEEDDQQATAKRLGFMSDARVLEQPSLIGLSERKRYARQARGIQWRLREVALRRRPVDLVRFAARPPFGEPFDLEGVPLVGKDLSLGGLAVHKASLAAVRNALSIAEERHVAANWLIGTARLYSEVDTPT